MVIAALKAFRSKITDAVRIRFWLFISCLKLIWNGHIPDDFHIAAIHSWYFERSFKAKFASTDAIKKRTLDEFTYAVPNGFKIFTSFGRGYKNAMILHYEGCDQCQTFSIRYFAKLQEESLFI